MIRQAARAAIALVLFAAVLHAVGLTQPVTQDKIYYRDKKDNSVRNVEGDLKVGPAGWQVGTGKTVTVIPTPDLLRVVPGEMPQLDRQTLLAQIALEDKRDWAKARAGYVEMQKLAKAPPDKVKRFLEFKVAFSAARAADEAKDDESWKPQAEEAVKLLDSFLVGHTSGWEVWPAARAAAGLQAELGKFPDVASVWARVAANKELPGDARAEAVVHEIDARIRARRWGDAQTKAEELLKTEPAGSRKTRLGIYQVAAAKGITNPEQAIPAIEAEIAKSQDPAVRGTAYSMLGEMHLTGDKPNVREAMWAFLWVEVVYNQDKDDLLTALVRLATVFELQGDTERAKSYREKARRLRGGM